MRLNTPKMSNIQEDEAVLEEDSAVLNGYNSSIAAQINNEDYQQIDNISNLFSEAQLG